MSHFEDYSINRLPPELFREILSFLPQGRIVGLRLVCKLWKARIDADHWPFRAIYSKSTNHLNGLKRHVCDNFINLTKYLEHVDVDMRGANHEFYRALPDDFCRLDTFIIREVQSSPHWFVAFCDALPTLNLVRLELHRLTWEELDDLIPYLPDCSFLSDLKLDMSKATRREMEEAWRDAEWRWSHSETGDFENLESEPNGEYTLPELRSLYITFFTEKTYYTWEPEIESAMYAMLHRPLLSILHAAKGLEDVKIANTFDKSIDVPPGERITAYKGFLKTLGFTHPYMKKLHLEQLEVHSWNVPGVKELTIYECEPEHGYHNRTVVDQNSHIEKLSITFAAGHPWKFEDIPLSKHLTDYKAYDLGGGAMVAFTTFLRALVEPVLTLRVVQIVTLEDTSARSEDLINDMDIQRIIKYFPNLGTFEFIAELNCDEDAGKTLWDGLPLLRKLRLEYSTLTWSPPRKEFEFKLG